MLKSLGERAVSRICRWNSWFCWARVSRKLSGRACSTCSMCLQASRRLSTSAEGAALRGEGGGVGFEHASDGHDFGGVVVGPGGDERSAPGFDGDQAVGLEAFDGVADRGAADVELVADGVLDEVLAGGEDTAFDVVLEAAVDVVGWPAHLVPTSCLPDRRVGPIHCCARAGPRVRGWCSIIGSSGLSAGRLRTKPGAVTRGSHGTRVDRFVVVRRGGAGRAGPGWSPRCRGSVGRSVPLSRRGLRRRRGRCAPGRPGPGQGRRRRR